jgi:NAD-dependent dihydropyrimidine dehydrogenase PreA subunit
MPIEKIDQDLCNGCEICFESCPMDVIGFNEETKRAYIKYQKDCVACYNCELDCPVDGIFVTPHRGTLITPAW